MANTKKSEVKDAKVSETKPKKNSTSKSSPKKSNSPKKDVNKKSTSKTTIVQEENNYAGTLFKGILILLILVGGFFAYKKATEKKDEEKIVLTEDEKRFKKEYESLNNTVRSNGIKNKSIEVIDNNNIKYINVKEASKILDEGSGVIYFGFAACPWCRNAVPELLTAMTNTSLDTIYYVDVRPNDDSNNDIRDAWELNTRNKAFKKKDADEAYYKILISLANELQDYVLTTDSGKKVNTGEKRLSAPTVVAVLNGEIVGFHEGTVENHEKDKDGNLRDLTKEEKEKLVDTYTKIITKYKDNECGSDGGC